MLSALVGAQRLFRTLLSAVQGLFAAAELPSHHGSSRKSLSQDLADLYNQFPQGVNIEAVGILLERVVEQPDDEEQIWSAVYELFREVSVPPSTPTNAPEDNSTNIETKG